MGHSLKGMDNNMDVEQQFNDAGVDGVIGTELMYLLGVNQYDLTDPMRFQRFQDVAQFLKNNPDRKFTINKLIAGKMVDKLDHVWGYAELNRQKIAGEMNIMKAKQNLFGLEKNSPVYKEKYKESEKAVKEETERVHNIIHQMSYYER